MLEPATLHRQWFHQPQPGHVVQFYETENSFHENLFEFVASGLDQLENCIVIASQRTRSLLERQLKKDHDTEAILHDGKLVALDAVSMLNLFMHENMPDRTRFRETVGSLVEQAAAGGRPVRVFCDMVALLWQKGNRDAVICLETLWDELAERYRIAKYCAYPDLHFILDTDTRQDIDAIHSLHLAADVQ